ncbi:MAG TPA: hypothetical protein VNJ47_10355 [Nevskiales bacterium]|nr:hypothetical protein [Nevskiales bacterium]
MRTVVWLWMIGLLFLTGCAASMPSEVVPEARASEPVSTTSNACKTYQLTQDCKYTVPLREVYIADLHTNVAGSSDGKVVLLMSNDPRRLENILVNAGTPAAIYGAGHQYKNANNVVFQAAKQLLEENNIQILKVEPWVNVYNLVGYILTLDGDGYSIIKQQPIEPCINS